jgi:hypothetical protein
LRQKSLSLSALIPNCDSESDHHWFCHGSFFHFKAGMVYYYLNVYLFILPLILLSL